MAEGVGEAEVEDLHAAVLAEEDVGRLEVPVDDAVGVGVGQGSGGGRADSQRLGGQQGAVVEPGGERPATEQLQDEIGSVRAPPHVEERDDARVGQAGRDLRLLEQPHLAHAALSPGANCLECDAPAVLPIDGFPDHAEATTPDLPDQLESPCHHPWSEPAPPAVPHIGRRSLGELLEQAAHRSGRGVPGFLRR
jgi:hypothetical protein